MILPFMSKIDSLIFGLSKILEIVYWDRFTESYVMPTPSLIAHGRPIVEIFRVTSDIHHTVVNGRPA